MPKISEPFQLKGLHLRNRMVMAPMVTGLAVDARPTQAQIDWYVQRARNGVGLVVVESTAIAEDARIMPGNLGIWEDAQVPGLAELAGAIQALGVPAVLQVVHGGARAWRADASRERVAPSAVALLPGPAPRPMTEAEIEGTLESFVQAARRAQAAGFQGVELHAAHYYLLSQFLSPYTNRRADRWGGNLEGRLRFPVEVARAVRRAVGPDYPVFCRLHGQENLEGGLEGADAQAAAVALRQAGVDVLDVSGIGQSSLGEWQGGSYLNTSSVLPKGVAGGAYGPATGRLRAATGLPVIAVGKLSEPGIAQQLLDRGEADLVALARPLIADPMAAVKVLEGRFEDLARCEECLACFAAIRKGPIRCSVNQDL